MTSLHSLIHRKIIVLPRTATLREVARAMLDNQVGCALISGPEGETVGIITDRDLACHWGTEDPRADRSVDEVMTHELIAANESAGLENIINLMETHGVRRIPIIGGDQRQAKKTNKKRRFVGLVTLDDLIAAELIEPSQLSRVIRRQLGKRFLENRRPFATSRGSDDSKNQTLQRFYSHMIGTTGLSKDLISPITHFILGCLIMRISLTGAMHFIAQLPELIQDPLQQLPPGPDKMISSRMIIDELVSRFYLTETYSQLVLHRFIFGLATWMSPGQLDHLKAQLPVDFHPYFEPIAHTKAQPTHVFERSTSFMTVTSPAFLESSAIPRTFTGDGTNRSPQIEWSNVPNGTREFALICEDPDAPTETPWVHWVIYGISNSITQLPEGFPEGAEVEVPILARQGKNTSGTNGYQGPLPPEKDTWHRYYFHVYALDREIALSPEATADELRQEMQGHILGEGVLMGRYKRARKAAA